MYASLIYVFVLSSPSAWTYFGVFQYHRTGKQLISYHGIAAATASAGRIKKNDFLIFIFGWGSLGQRQMVHARFGVHESLSERISHCISLPMCLVRPPSSIPKESLSVFTVPRNCSQLFKVNEKGTNASRASILQHLSQKNSLKLVNPKMS